MRLASGAVGIDVHSLVSKVAARRNGRVNDGKLAAIVTASASAAQVFFLIALVVFVLAAIVAAMSQQLPHLLLYAGLALLSAGLLWLA